MEDRGRTVKASDFHKFFRETGIDKELPCPRCGEPKQFGWTDDPDRMGDGEWIAPELGANADPGKDNFFQSCDKCGFVEVYFLKQFFKWLDEQ